MPTRQNGVNWFVAGLIWVILSAGSCGSGLVAAETRIRILVTTGGHGFDEKAFFEMFDAIKNIQYAKAVLPKDLKLLRPGLEKDFDVLVRYDMGGKINAEEQEAFAALLEAGIGLVSLHHNLGSHAEWPGYAKIVGGKYVFKETTIDGKPVGKSNYAHDQRVKVCVVDKKHPVTADIVDFEIQDEVYGNCYVSPGVHVLLTTSHPKSTSEIGWVTKFGKSPVAYLMLGHDAKAYGDPSYRKLVSNAIRWAATR